MPFNHSASTCIKLLLIICLKLAKVTSKQYLDALSITRLLLFSRLKERSLLNLFIQQMKDLMNAKLLLENSISWCATYNCSN